MLFDFRRKKIQGSYKPQSNIRVARKQPIIANLGGGGGFGSQGTNGLSSGSFPVSRYTGNSQSLADGNITQEWMPSDPVGLHALWRQIYLHDSISGPTIDLISYMPWSDEWNLVGIDDAEKMKPFQDSLENFNLGSLMPALTAEYLMIGRSIMSLLFSEKLGCWTDIMPIDPDFAIIDPVPVLGVDPKIDINVSPAQKAAANSMDPRDLQAFKQFPPSLLESLKRGGRIPLDPLNTAFLGRRTTMKDFIGTSLLTRVLPWYALEQNLITGTLLQSRRRQKDILDISVGLDDVWEPDLDEIDQVIQMYIQADEDPVGAVVGHRKGIEANYLSGGSGRDAWKISDEIEMINQMKMRSLSVNEAFISGEACLVGDTLIPTDQGLVTIGSLGEKDGPQWQDLNLTVAGRYANEKAVKWLYNGFKETLKINTERGNNIQCTLNHPCLVFNPNTGETDWKRSEHLDVGDLLCASTKLCVSSEKLTLVLSDPQNVVHGGQRKDVIKPTEMTPDLAFMLGLIVSEGTIYKSQIRIPNTDTALLDKFEECCQKVFGLSCARYVNFDPEIHTANKRFKNQKKSYETCISSKTVTEWLAEIGAYPEKLGDKPMSYYKEVPWSILQANEECWYAYLAGFIEGDGCLTERLQIISTSEKILSQTQAMLNALGFTPKKYSMRLEIQALETQLLCERIGRYLVSKKVKLTSTKARNSFGVPNGYWANLIDSRKIKDTRYGSYFLNDAGQEIVVSKGFNNVTRQEVKFLYDRYDKGQYDTFLARLEEISVSAHRKLLSMLKLRYKLTPIVEIVKGGKQHVYDISMDRDSEPAFVANGLVVHNSYNNMEVSLSVFMENLRVLRENITKKFFYYNVFPPLARAYGLRKVTKNELDNRIRIKPSKEEVESQIQDSIKMAMSAKADEIPQSELLIPQIHWSKQLKPEADSSYLDVLSTMEEKGIPIPLRTWAAAGGLDLQGIAKMLEEDADIRQSIQDWKRGLGSDSEDVFASKVVATAKSKLLKSLPIFKDSNVFYNLTIQEAEAFISKELSDVKTVAALSSPERMTDLLWKTFENSHKVGAMKFILRRLNITPFAIDEDVLKKAIAVMEKAGASEIDVTKEAMLLRKKQGESSKTYKDKNFKDLMKNYNISSQPNMGSRTYSGI